MSSTLILASPDFEQHFILYSDAFKIALGGVSCQIQNRKERIGCFDRTLHKTERKQESQKEKLWGWLKVWNYSDFFIYGHHAKCFVDQNSLK